MNDTPNTDLFDDTLSALFHDLVVSLAEPAHEAVEASIEISGGQPGQNCFAMTFKFRGIPADRAGANE